MKIKGSTTLSDSQFPKTWDLPHLGPRMQQELDHSTCLLASGRVTHTQATMMAMTSATASHIFPGALAQRRLLWVT